MVEDELLREIGFGLQVAQYDRILRSAAGFLTTMRLAPATRPAICAELAPTMSARHIAATTLRGRALVY